MKNENLVCGTLNGSTAAPAERKVILDQLRLESITADTINKDNIRFFEAITHTNASEF